MVVGESVCAGAFRKGGTYCSNVLVSESVVRPPSTRRLERILTALPPHRVPTVCRLAGHPETTGHLGLGHPRLEVLSGEASAR